MAFDVRFGLLPLQGPIAITNTHSFGVVRDSVIGWQAQNDLLLQPWSLPIVAETYDGYLNDINGFHVKKEHVLEAIANAGPGAVVEGGVGGGTGMMCYGFKGGIGTASRLVTGTPGGPTIINTVLQTILNVVDFGFNAQEAVDAPRFHHQWMPDRIDYEKRSLVRDVTEALEAKGHALHERGLIGDAQAIYVDADTRIRMAGSDPRRGGAAVGQKDDPE